MKFRHVQTVLDEETIKKLLEKSKERYIKYALEKAIRHYIECDNIK